MRTLQTSAGRATRSEPVHVCEKRPRRSRSRSRHCVCLVILFALHPTLAAAQGAWETRTSGEITVHVYAPAAAAPEAGRPLLVALHGCSQSASTLRDEGGFEDTAEAHGMVVAVPRVPGGGVIAGCWDYYGASHDREAGPEGALLDLVAELLADRALELDPARVAVAGLSSGGGMALVLGCLAPDVFSGVAAVAGPAPGTTAMEIAVVATTADAAGDVCRDLAGASAPSFERQRAVLVTGTADPFVAEGYAPLEAEMLADLYAEASGAALASARFDLATLAGHEPRGDGTVWTGADGAPRVALLVVEGLGHAWPAGAGPDGGCESDFVTCAGPDLTAFLASFFEPDATSPGSDPGHADAGPDGEGAGCVAAAARPRDAALPLALLGAAIAFRMRRRT